jgi:hypothetical protein
MKKELDLRESLNRMKNIIGLPINENNLYEDDLFEIDWEGDFSDVKKTCIPLPELTKYLNALISNRGVATKDREKFPTSLPFIHANTRLLGTDKEYKEKTAKGSFESTDVETFIKRMTAPPNNVVNTNEKMLKSGGPNDFVYKTGLPAFRGLAYDLANNKFVIINTCPGAGKCRQGCYALSGNYIQYPASYDSMTRRLNYLLNFPKEYEERLYKELKDKCIEHKALKGYKFRVMFRWNDSGDFFTQKYVKIAENVMSRLKNEGYNIISAAHTKIASVAQDSELDSTSFSADANKREFSKINPEIQKLSVRFPRSEFKDLDLDKIDDLMTLKERVAEYYDVPNIDDVISYDEMMSIKDTGVKKYYVIITPDDGDDAVHRSDVKRIIHTEH